jgi:archaellum biogenesis ATPase FlaH
MMASISIEERIKIVRHRAFNSTLRYCMAVDDSPPGTLLFVVGPSGAGKSVLSKLLGEMLYGRRSPGTELSIRASVENAEGGFFTSKYLIEQMLAELRDPFHGMDLGLPPDIDSESATRLAFALRRIETIGRTSEEKKRVALINVARARRLRLMIIDEANLMVLTKKSRPVESHLESIRTLAKAMGVRVVMLGTLHLLDYVNYSAQISRTGMILHLSRMKCDCKEDMLEFLSFLDRVEEDALLPSGFLVDRADLLYEATYGIPGELISLLERARCVARSSERDQIEIEDIRSSMHIPVVMERMRAEADLIESFVNGVSGGRKLKAIAKGKSRMQGLIA